VVQLSITPSGSVQVAHGANQAFTIQANAGYMIQDVLADGVSIGPVPVHAFYEVVSDHRISATFILQKVTHTITSVAGPGGRILPEGKISVPHASNAVFRIMPDPNYSIAGVAVDGTPVGAVAGHVFYNVTSDHVIYAVFRYSPKSK